MTRRERPPGMAAPGGPSVSTVTASDEQTEAVARALAGSLAAGTFVLLYGELGAGKTVFVRGLAAGLGADPDDVSSPTFTLVQEYRGRVPLQHVDLYRVERGVDVEELGLDELARAGAVVAVEWAERLGVSPPGAVAVQIVVHHDDTREIRIARPADTRVLR